MARLCIQEVVLSKLRELTNLTVKARNTGHCGIFTGNDLALMMQTPLTNSFSKSLYKATQAGVLTKVCKNIFINPLTPPDNTGILAKIASLIHWEKLIYISLESQLSHLGRISQVMMNHITVMTTGRKGKIKTLYGVIEFTHTHKALCDISNDLYFDNEIGVFRAKEEKALKDLKSVGRNLHMIEEING